MVEAKVIYATSHDPNYPPGAMLDGRHDTFWATGGLYPQVIVVTLPSVTSVENVTFTAYNIRKVKLARSLKTQPTDFEDILEQELLHAEGKLQSTVLSPEQISAAHLRLTIVEGHGHFCSVHKFSITGSQNAAQHSPTAALLLSTTKEEGSPPSSRLSSQSPEDMSSQPPQKPRAPVQVMPKDAPVTMVSSLFEDDEAANNKFIAEDISEDDIQEF
ncbi:intraflagellar transport protein 25 homolog [Penaeus japonicus]|uniref:intraflagellar transport protein 25 homolog n=1 Tax=Penaeus japonicus TaxID=27405 RepID=UPI001C70D319|nr:intraflagellar transport protein 25 homolog [Penaeus japonicus]